MNALKMCVVPVVFLSTASCTVQFGGTSEVKRIGVNLLIASSSAAYESSGASFSVILVNIMPSNMMRTFLEGDMLQLIVPAVFIEVAFGGSWLKLCAASWTRTIEFYEDH